MDFNEINTLIKEYFRFHELDSTLDMFQSEERTKYYNNKGAKGAHQLNIVPVVSSGLLTVPGHGAVPALPHSVPGVH